MTTLRYMSRFWGINLSCCKVLQVRPNAVVDDDAAAAAAAAVSRVGIPQLL